MIIEAICLKNKLKTEVCWLLYFLRY